VHKTRNPELVHSEINSTGEKPSVKLFDQIEMSLNGYIALRTFTSNSRKLTREKFHNSSVLACEFIAHYACRSAEMKLKFTTKSGFKLRIMNSLIECWGEGREGGGTLELDLA